ncbi:MAG: aminotransferase class IV [Cyanobacteria bacterium P01_A01_bin.40]
MFWYDGQQIDSEKIVININDPGLCFGATVFSTMRVYEKSLAHPLTSWQAHCDRLKTTIQAFNWQQPNWQQLQQGAELLATKFSVLRLTIFDNGREWIKGRSLPIDLHQRQREGITAWVAQDSRYTRELPQYKTGNYLAAYLARNQALSLDTQEAILIDTQGNWLETSTGNLWGWKQGCWYTPHLDSGILPGIARSRWQQFFQAHEYEVRENIWTADFVQSLESLAYSNCVIDFVPIKTVIDAENQTNYSIQQPGSKKY